MSCVHVAPMIMKTHPLTGEPIEPVGVVGGRPVWPIMGGAPDDDDGDDGDKDGDAGDGGDDGGDDGKGGDSGDGSGDTVSKADYDRLMKRMQESDRARTAAEKKVKEAEDAKKDDLTKATDELTEAQDKITALQKQVSGLRLENAFLVANKHPWHDPEVALGLAQTKGYLDDVVGEEDGEVDKKALKKALDRLATEHKYLIKPKEKDDDEPAGPSGEPGGKRSSNQDDDKAKKAKLKERFPVLNGR